jgi:hypothetical protein
MLVLIVSPPWRRDSCHHFPDGSLRQVFGYALRPHNYFTEVPSWRGGVVWAAVVALGVAVISWLLGAVGQLRAPRV